MEPTYFYPAEILLPRRDCDYSRFSVVACDQFTSQPEYWQRVRRTAGDAPSAVHLVFPEAELETADFNQRIGEINQTMLRYLKEGVFDRYPDALVYVERTQRDGAVRQGLVGCIDLEQYEYAAGAKSAVRATEGTVLERIPPRVKIRQDAPLEIPHVMLLADDRENRFLLPLADCKASMEQLYDFPLMEQSGSLSGWLLTPELAAEVSRKVDMLADPQRYRALYDADENPMVFAVGDGNHSLASAKARYEQLKQELPPDEAARHPARFAMAELVSLHDNALVFEPIHRVVFGVDRGHLLRCFQEECGASAEPGGATQAVTVVAAAADRYGMGKTTSKLPVGTLQNFLDGYLGRYGGKVDYIHGEEVVYSLCAEGDDRIGFLLPGMDKESLFPAVIHDGALPRKTFSMGEAWDKRFYLEARSIK